MTEPIEWHILPASVRSKIVDETIQFRTVAARFFMDGGHMEKSNGGDGHKEELRFHQALLNAMNIQSEEHTNPIALTRTIQGIGTILSSGLALSYEKAYELYEEKVRSEISELQTSMGKEASIWENENLISKNHPLIQTLSEKGTDHIRNLGISLLNLEAGANLEVDENELLEPEIHEFEEHLKKEESKLSPENFRAGNDEATTDKPLPPRRR